MCSKKLKKTDGHTIQNSTIALRDCGAGSLAKPLFGGRFSGEESVLRHRLPFVAVSSSEAHGSANFNELSTVVSLVSLQQGPLTFFLSSPCFIPLYLEVLSCSVIFDVSSRLICTCTCVYPDRSFFCHFTSQKALAVWSLCSVFAMECTNGSKTTRCAISRPSCWYDPSCWRKAPHTKPSAWMYS